MILIGQMMTSNKLTIFETLHAVTLVLIVSALNVQNVVCRKTFQSSAQLVSERDNSEIRLKICEGEAPLFDSVTDITEIPTFSTKRFSYDLKKYAVDNKNPMTSCPNGQTPVDHDGESTLSKAEFDKKFESSNFSTALLIKDILRSAHMFLDNGYLSMGNHTAQTVTYYSVDEFCIASIEGKGIQTTVEFRTCSFSESRPILHKCCPLGMMLETDSMSCVSYNGTEKWNPGYMDANTRKILAIDKANPVYKSTSFSCDPDATEVWTADDCTLEFHPVTDNTIAFVGATRTWNFIPAGGQWCLEAKYVDGRERMELFQCFSEEQDVPPPPSQAHYSYLYMITMYVGAFFHFMTTIVHLITWRKQNIHGRTLCSCTASLFLMHCFLGTAHLLGILQLLIRSPICVINGIVAQFFMMAAFTWMLVLNFDLWETISSVRLEGADSLKPIVIYSLVGWGFPFLISVISVTLNFTFTCRVSGVPIPAYGEYYCFVAPWAQGIYVYYIQGALTGTAVLFAVLTIYELCKWKRNTANLRSQKGSKDKDNVLLFLKLSVVMGLTWIFETISWAVTKENENQIGWIIIDVYNFLSAILIFIIFVCKIETLRLLEQSVPALKGITNGWTKLTSSLTRESTFRNTVSTSADESRNIVSRVAADSEGPTTVRYMKTKDKDYGSANKAFE